MEAAGHEEAQAAVVRHFFERRKYPGGETYNHCLHCDWKEKCIDSSTSNMWRHLCSDKHKLSKEALKNLEKLGESNPRPRPGLTAFFKPNNELELKLLTVMLICVDLLPVSVGEGEGSPIFLFFAFARPPSSSQLLPSIFAIFFKNPELAFPSSQCRHGLDRQGLQLRPEKYFLLNFSPFLSCP